MKNWEKITLFRTTWTEHYQLWPQRNSLLARFPPYIHYMTPLSSTSVYLIQLFLSLPNKAWGHYHCKEYFPMVVNSASLHHSGAYTNCRLGTSILINLMNHRKSLGLIWTFNAPRSLWHKDCCVTLPQDNHTCEVCHSLLRWLHMYPKGRRALPQERNWPAP